MQFDVELPFGGRLVIDADVSTAGVLVAQYQERLKNRKKLMAAIANAMRADVRRQFAVGGDPPWAPLASSTIARKTKQGLPRKNASGRTPWRLRQNGEFSAANILIATGRLRDSWGLKGNAEHVENIDEQTGEVEIGSKVPYAKYHQSDQPRKRSKSGKIILPRRPVNVTQAGQQAMAQAYRSYLLGDSAGLEK